MIQNLRQIKSRIRSVENTKKITRAMEMISASKLNKVKNALFAYRPYRAALESLLTDALSDIETPIAHPFLEDRPVKKEISICVIGSDTGLCGTYNSNIIKFTEESIGKIGKEKVLLTIVGKEIYRYFIKKSYAITNSYFGLYGRFSGKTAQEIGDVLRLAFLSGNVDEVYFIYTRFISGLRMRPVFEKALSMQVAVKSMQAASQNAKKYYIIEPNATRVIDKLVPQYYDSKVKGIMLDAFTSEHSARMMAMKAATDNADDLISTLTLIRNKARQAAITKEVLEIAMSAEALKG